MNYPKLVDVESKEFESLVGIAADRAYNTVISQLCPALRGDVVNQIVADMLFVLRKGQDK